MMMPKKRQSSGIPHLSEPFVAAEEYAYRREKSPRLSGDVRREGKDGLSGLSGLFGLSCWSRCLNQKSQTNQNNQRNQMNKKEIKLSGAIFYRSHPTSSPKKSSTTSKRRSNNSD
jgi:hypothetical protein